MEVVFCFSRQPWVETGDKTLRTAAWGATLYKVGNAIFHLQSQLFGIRDVDVGSSVGCDVPLHCAFMHFILSLSRWQSTVKFQKKFNRGEILMEN